MLTFNIDDLMKHRELTGLPKWQQFPYGYEDTSSKGLTLDSSQSTAAEHQFGRNFELSPVSSASSTDDNTRASFTTETSTLMDETNVRVCEGRVPGDKDSAIGNFKSPVQRSPDEFLSHSSTSSIDSSSSDTESIAQILLSLERKANLIKSPLLFSSSEDQQSKPEHSYIALISMALLESPEKKLVLADIYQYIMDKFPYYDNKEKAWRNSVRHNLSLNECFIKNGRAENGKGNYWSIHPACVEDFSNGDYRRRHARRRARKTSKELTLPICSPMNYSFGYVPMTSSAVNHYHPYLGTPGGMLWSQPPMPASRSFFPSTGLFTQNVFQPDYFPQSFGQISRQPMPFYSPIA